MLEGVSTQKVLRPGIDFANGALWYGLDFKEKVYFLSTGHRVYEAKDLPGGLTVGKGTLHGTPISREGIKRYLSREKVDGAKLLEELTSYFRRHAKFQYDTLPAVLAHWVVAGYAHMAFPIFPYLSLTSAQRQCGKSKVLELLAEVGFRAKPIAVNLTSAVLYRSLHASGQVLLIDEFENATDDTQRALISVLNAGFQRGAEVPRCAGDEFRIEYFQAYSPKAFAGLSRIPEALQSRSIPVLMFPKLAVDNIEPFSPVMWATQTSRWIDDAGIWALTNAPDLAVTATMPRHKLGIPEFLEDREADYMATLFATNLVAGADRKVLLDYCFDLAGTRRNQFSQGRATRAVQALAAWFQNGQEVAKVFLSDLAPVLFDCDAIPESTEREAGDLLRKLGMDPKQIRIGTESKKGLQWTKKKMDDLTARFATAIDTPTKSEAA
jgi:hypothetical protein